MTDTHLRRFAKDHIERHGPSTPGMIWHAFANVLGNPVDGNSIEEQHQFVADHLLAAPSVVDMQAGKTCPFEKLEDGSLALKAPEPAKEA